MYLGQSYTFSFFEIKFLLLIPNILLGIFAFIHTKIQLSDNLRLKNHHVFGAIVVILLCFFLLINKADNNSQIYLVLKSSVNFCFIFVALTDLNNELTRRKFVSLDAVINLKKNQQFLIALFLIVIVDVLVMCFEILLNSSYNLHIYSSLVYLILTIFIGYNELFYKMSKYNSRDTVFEDDLYYIEDESDDEDHIDMENDYIYKNKTNITDERVIEIVTIIEKYVANNRYFYRDPDIKAKQMAVHIDVKYIEFSHALKKHFGLTFNSYINSLRIEEAKELIRNNEEMDYTIEAIGEIVGFKTKNSFYLAFKKFTNTTPSKY